MTFKMKPCWSCGARNRPCDRGCKCKKCVDPQGWEKWRKENPDEYYAYLATQAEDQEGKEYFWGLIKDEGVKGKSEKRLEAEQDAEELMKELKKFKP